MSALVVQEHQPSAPQHLAIPRDQPSWDELVRVHGFAVAVDVVGGRGLLDRSKSQPPQLRRPPGECVGQCLGTTCPCYGGEEALGVSVAVRPLPSREQRDGVPGVSPEVAGALEPYGGHEQQS